MIIVNILYFIVGKKYLSICKESLSSSYLKRRESERERRVKRIVIKKNYILIFDRETMKF